MQRREHNVTSGNKFSSEADNKNYEDSKGDDKELDKKYICSDNPIKENENKEALALIDHSVDEAEAWEPTDGSSVSLDV